MTATLRPAAPGFTLGAWAYQTHLRRNDLIDWIAIRLEGLDPGDPEALALACADIAAWITESPVPDEVAETLTEAVARLTGGAPVPVMISPVGLAPESGSTLAGSVSTDDDLLAEIRHAWASALWTPDAVVERARLGVDHLTASLELAITPREGVTPAAAASQGEEEVQLTLSLPPEGEALTKVRIPRGQLANLFEHFPDPPLPFDFALMPITLAGLQHIATEFGYRPAAHPCSPVELPDGRIAVRLEMPRFSPATLWQAPLRLRRALQEDPAAQWEPLAAEFAYVIEAAERAEMRRMETHALIDLIQGLIARFEAFWPRRSRAVLVAGVVHKKRLERLVKRAAGGSAAPELLRRLFLALPAEASGLPCGPDEAELADYESARIGLISRLGSGSAARTFSGALEKARGYQVARAESLALMERMAAQIRRAVLEVGTRLAAAGVLDRPEDVLFLMIGELRTAHLRRSGVRMQVSRRREGYITVAAAHARGVHWLVATSSIPASWVPPEFRGVRPEPPAPGAATLPDPEPELEAVPEPASEPDPEEIHT